MSFPNVLQFVNSSMRKWQYKSAENRAGEICQIIITQSCVDRFYWTVVIWCAMDITSHLWLKPRTTGGMVGLKWQCSANSSFRFTELTLSNRQTEYDRDLQRCKSHSEVSCTDYNYSIWTTHTVMYKTLTAPQVLQVHMSMISRHTKLTFVNSAHGIVKSIIHARDIRLRPRYNICIIAYYRLGLQQTLRRYRNTVSVKLQL